MLLPFCQLRLYVLLLRLLSGWSISDQAALVSIRTWTQMVEQRCGHGPDKIIKQEHMHFITLIHQRTLSIQTISLSSFRLRLCVFVGFAVKFKFRKLMMHMQLEDTSKMCSSCNSSLLILALAFQCSHVYSTAISITPDCIYKVLGRIVKVVCSSSHYGAYEL